MKSNLTTLCYLERADTCLMLHRTVKKNDVNHDKWIGVGGHFEKDESPEDCVVREVREETGFTLTDFRLRGIVTFISGRSGTEYMFLYTASGWTGDPAPCDEGELLWVNKEQVRQLNTWEGDRIFLHLLERGSAFFSLKLVYDAEDVLREAVLDGRKLTLPFDPAESGV